MKANGVEMEKLKITPLTGVRIEICTHSPRRFQILSHPSRVRGLKWWKRGSDGVAKNIAPHTGARIEIAYPVQARSRQSHRTPHGCAD